MYVLNIPQRSVTKCCKKANKHALCGLVTTMFSQHKSDVCLLDGLPLDDDPRHIITADRSGTCSLILDSLTAQDSGQYACYANSFMGSAGTLAKVVVQGECMDAFQPL